MFNDYFALLLPLLLSNYILFLLLRTVMIRLTSIAIQKVITHLDEQDEVDASLEDFLNQYQEFEVSQDYYEQEFM